MGKQIQKMIIMGTLPFLLGLSACSLTWDEPVYFEGEGPENTATTEELSNIIVGDIDLNSGLEAPCLPNEEECAVSDGYLTQTFTQTETAGKELNLTDDTSISLSRPAGKNAVSVKDKQAGKTLKGTSSASATKGAAAGVAATTTAVATTTAATPTETKEETSKTETEDKVLYTTLAIPEEIGTSTTTETTLTTTKITKNPVVSESVPADVPAGMMPLKKTITTITETTTKVKQEKEEKETKDFKTMTLAEKVAYGESVQEWDAAAGTTLRTLLMDWGSKSGWTVVWKLDRDYHLEAGVVFKGTFVDVSGALIRSFARATPAPIGTFHQGNRVLVISTQEDENER